MNLFSSGPDLTMSGYDDEVFNSNAPAFGMPGFTVPQHVPNPFGPNISALRGGTGGLTVNKSNNMMAMSDSGCVRQDGGNLQDNDIYKKYEPPLFE